MLNNIKFGLKVPFYPLDLILEAAKYAETNSYDSLWCADHLVGISLRRWDSFSVWSLLSSFAVQTRNILLGSSVTDACRIHPAVLTQIAMTIQYLSKGRFVLGIGAGEAQNLLPYGIRCDRPVTRLKETTEIIQDLLSNDEVNYDGELYQLRKASINPKPSNFKNPPIWIAANSQKTFRLTGMLGDGWLPMAIKLTPTSYSDALKNIRSTAVTTGRNPEAIEPGLFIHTCVSKDYDTARQVAEETGRLIFLVWGPERFEEIGIMTDTQFRSDKLVFDSEMAHTLAETLPTLPVEPVHKYLVFGRPDDCIEGFSRYVKAGVRHFVVALFAPPGQYKETLQLFTEQVLGYFKGIS